ncbi:hypothetical protein NH341_14395 [Tenacibaculum sp. XPcli2-G]|uniref:hypothetical protein n=1 Tax=Tenacibaculum sp. XPcli2-G TaxID=2954503 RepID=UPI002097779F|nr:hypothetical protein [Tenacibaculum sp. XPcli2-G]MCO7186608.1 hypothetical protein [Tenacibaculum sp. XPcli2-G]
MKTLKNLMFVSIFFMVFTSCQNEETVLLDETQTETLDTKAAKSAEDLKLDYHEDYGVVRADEYPMNPNGLEKPTLDLFLERGNLKKEDLKSYRIVKDEFSGVGLAEHRMKDGNVIQVPHEYQRQPVYRFEAELNDGTKVRIIIIIICSNGLIIIFWW